MNVHELYPSKWIKAHDLMGKHVTVTVAKLTVEAVGQDQQEKPVLWFAGKTKGLILNKTNAMQIASLHGPETDNWVGKAITLYLTRCGRSDSCTTRCALPTASTPTATSKR